ncbi:unnamed protein product [Blepharisma stoltei]|uniref:Uncharacterized protein n=1 Tax=Blepharisma stoltei TaxID=1481888 RepID=A0AAU9JGS0_9CILI|nr:unnamed protein product [Blepharisma stoltei]
MLVLTPKLKNSNPEKQKKLHETSEFELKRLYGIRSTKEGFSLCIYEIDAHRIRYVECMTQIMLSPSTSLTQLPNSELFCFGSFPLSGATCIIDLKNFKVKRKLPDGISCHNSKGIYYKNSVYLFGGSNRWGTLNLAQKFDLVENRWSCLPLLPIASHRCSLVVYKEFILICGNNHTCIYKYDLEIESYSEVPNISFPKYSNRILFTVNLRVYAVVNKVGIFESGELDENNWTLTSDNYFEAADTYIDFQESIYFGWFLGYKSIYYKFSLQEKRIEQLEPESII